MKVKHRKVWNTPARTRQLWAFNDQQGLWRMAQAEATRRGRTLRVPEGTRRTWLITYLILLEQS